MERKIFSNLLVLGLGLMGGSLALAAQRAGVAAKVSGWSRTESTLQQAVAAGAIDSYETDLSTALASADGVVIATPTQFAENLMLEVVQQVEPSVVVTDVASVKGNLARALRDRFGQVPANVVLGHPIAGSEKSGINAARDDLYQNQLVVLVDEAQADADAVARISNMWQAVGARLHFMTSDEHDQMLALTSHLPHILAYAMMLQLLNSESADQVFQFAGGGFRDFTRIAGSDSRMWREIVLANKDQVLTSIDDYIVQLTELKDLLVSDRADELERRFERASQARGEYQLGRDGNAG